MRARTSIQFARAAALGALLAAGAARADDAPQVEEPVQAQPAPGAGDIEDGQPVTLRLDQGFALDLPAG